MIKKALGLLQKTFPPKFLKEPFFKKNLTFILKRRIFLVGKEIMRQLQADILLSQGIDKGKAVVRLWRKTTGSWGKTKISDIINQDSQLPIIIIGSFFNSCM